MFFFQRWRCLGLLFFCGAMSSAWALEGPSIEEWPRVDLPFVDARLSEWLRVGDTPRAESVLAAVVAKNPQDWKALVNWALMKQRQGKYPEAQVLLQRAQAIAPHDPIVLGALGYLYGTWGARPHFKPAPPETALLQSKRYLSEALKRAPSDPLLLLYDAELKCAEDPTQAKALLLKRLEANPTHVPTLLWASTVYQFLGDFNHAKQSVLIAYELDPENPMVLDAIAEFLAKMERPEDALHYIEEASLRDFSSPPERIRLKAQQYEKLADPQQAVLAYQQLQVYFPNSPELRLKEARLLEATADQKQADRAFQEASRLNPALLPDLMAEAQALIIKESLDAAKRPLQDVLRLSPEHPEFLEWVTLLYYRDLLLGRSVPAEELASVQRLLQGPQSHPLKSEWSPREKTVVFNDSPPLQQLHVLRLKIVAQDGYLDAEDLRLLKSIQQGGVRPELQVEASFLLGDMDLALSMLQRMPPMRDAKTAEALGHRWRLMQFIPAAIQAFQWASVGNASPSARQRVLELEGVNQRLEARLGALASALPKGAKQVKKLNAEAFAKQLSQAHQEANTALQLNPCHPLPFQVLAEVAELQGNWGRAVFLWQEAHARYLNAEGPWVLAVGERLTWATQQATAKGMVAQGGLSNRRRAVPASRGYVF